MRGTLLLLTLAALPGTAAAQDAEADVYRARLGQGRASLLAPDGTFDALLRSGRTLGGIARSLLD